MMWLFIGMLWIGSLFLWGLLVYEATRRGAWLEGASEAMRAIADEVDDIISDVDGHPEFIDDLFAMIKDIRETADTADVAKNNSN